MVPKRVYFHSPVSPQEIVNNLASYDMGFYLLPFTNYNNSVALPNKFFDFIMAGLAVCIGPSPEMARLTNIFEIGVVSDTFEPQEVAAKLNALSALDIDQYKHNAIKARDSLNADVEMQKLVNIYKTLLNDPLGD